VDRGAKKETNKSFKRLGRKPPPRKSDETRAMEYLAGYAVEQPDGPVTFQNLEPGSEREREARCALSRIFRGDSPIPSAIRARFGTLFDPDHLNEPRELVMQERPRRGGQSRKFARDVAIARFIAAKIKDDVKFETAKIFAAKRYGVSERTVERAWEKHGRVWQEKPDPSKIN
jgi:hypothetical protein